MSQLRVDEITDEVGTGSPSFPNGTPGFPLTSSDMPTGSVIQVVHAHKNDVFSTTSSSFVDIPGLSVSITPSNSSNKIVVFSSGAAGMSEVGSGALRLMRDSVEISIGATTSGYTSVSTPTFYAGSSDGNNNEGFSITFLDSPNTTSSVTYKLQAATLGTTETLVINGLGSDRANKGYSIRSASSIIVMEIAG